MVSVAKHLRTLDRALSSPEALAAIQLERLNRVLAAAAATEPYRTLWEPRFAPLRSAQQLETLPIIDRAELDAVPLNERIVEGKVAVRTPCTSGTTGPFFYTAVSADDDAFQFALMLRQQRLQGWELEVPHLAFLLGNARMSPLARRGLFAEIGAGVGVEQHAAAVRLVRPGYLSGPPSTLLAILDHLSPYSAKGLKTFGEVLDPAARADLRSGFGADPLDLYGSGEGGHIAWQCPGEGSYHLNADAVIIEILDEEGRSVPQNGEGEVVLTALWNLTTPIIRYRTGDIASLSSMPCRCGVQLPIMSQVQGREWDFLARYDGERVGPWELFLMLHERSLYPLLRRCRIVQRSVGDLLIEVVWRDEPKPDMVERLKAPLERMLGGPVTLDVRSVPAISTRAGSLRLIESWVWATRREGTGG